MSKTVFVDGNPTEEIEGTIVTAEFLNALNNHRHMGTAVDGDGAIDYAADTGSANAYAIALSPALTAHVTGMVITFKAANANTGASTLAVNGMPAVPIKKNVDGELTSGDIAANQLITVAYDGTNYQLISSPQRSQIQSITASVASNALTLNYAGGMLDFRSSTLQSGAAIKNVNVPALSLTVPSGATLGTVNGIQAMLALVVLYNGGSPALGVVNMRGGVNLDETTLLSTTEISADADADNVVYSASAIISSPFRVIGYIVITEATAGTWATGPTLVQGHGGQAMAALMSVGVGQTWQDVLGSRALGTTYYNTTCRPIVVSVCGSMVSGNGLMLTINDVCVGEISGNAAVEIYSTLIGVVPPGGSYCASIWVGSSVGLITWSELR